MAPRKDANNNINLEMFERKLDDIKETVHNTSLQTTVIGQQIENFSFRLRKLEERDERHLEKESKLEIIVQKLETLLEKNDTVVTHLEEDVKDLEERLVELDKKHEQAKQECQDRHAAHEKDITILKNNWGWVVALAGVLGGGAGWCITTLVSYMHHLGQ